MSFLSGLADVLLGGGATGMISGAISIWAKLQEKKIDIAHKQAEWRYTLEMTRENAKHESLLADKQLLIAKQVGADSLRMAAINAEAGLPRLQNVAGWVNNIRSLHRLVLTYVLIGAAIWMYWVARNQALAIIDASETQTYLTVFVTNAAASAIGFWFGDRVVSNEVNAQRRR